MEMCPVTDLSFLKVKIPLHVNLLMFPAPQHTGKDDLGTLISDYFSTKRVMQIALLIK